MENAYKICFCSIEDNNIIWFQYRILNRILGTKSHLHKLKITDNPICGFCNDLDETIMHLMIDCPIVKSLWNNIKTIVNTKTGIQISTTSRHILFGYHGTDTTHTLQNILYLIVKKYTFDCSRTMTPLNQKTLLSTIKRVYLEQEMLATINLKTQEFAAKWKDVGNLIQDV